MLKIVIDSLKILAFRLDIIMKHSLSKSRVFGIKVKFEELAYYFPSKGERTDSDVHIWVVLSVENVKHL